MQYIEALAVLVDSGWKPRRTVHVSFVPDEEIGGTDGFDKLVDGGRGRLWRELNVGADLDEGLPNPGPGFNVYYGERQTWWLIVEAEGAPAHGALAPETTAAQNIHRVLDRALKFRERERKKMFQTFTGSAQSGPLNIGDIVGVNAVFMDSGTRSNESLSGFIMNMVPSHARLGLDIRVPPQMPAEDMAAEIESWLSCGNETSHERCEGLSYYFQHKVLIPDTTERSHPCSNAFLDGLLESRANRSKPFAFPATFHAATDARFARAAGVPSIGFSPIENTPDRLHKHDEFISVDGYLAGIRIYESIIRRLADAWPESASSLSALIEQDVREQEPAAPQRLGAVISDKTEL
jgi:aminoacylase